MRKIIDYNELKLCAEGAQAVNKSGIWVKNAPDTWWLNDADWEREKNIVPCFLIEEGDFD